MSDALEKAGKPVEYMTKPKEGHGFFKEEEQHRPLRGDRKIPGESILGLGAPPAG